MSSTLYDRLGGESGIRAVVDEFYDRVLADEELAPFFERVDTDRLRERQTLHLCDLAGGPETYDGPSVRASHLHLPIEPDHVERTVGHLEASLDEFDVPESDARAVLDAVESFGEDLLATPED